jgi:hypothetical protein
MNAVVALAVTVAVLGLLALTAWRLRHRPVLAIVLWTQCLYWALAYVGRALVLLLVLPVPGVDDALADPRLYAHSYPASVSRVLWIVNAGLIVYVGAVHLLARRWAGATRARQGHGGRIRDCSTVLAWCTYLFGWGFRLVSYAQALPGVSYGQALPGHVLSSVVTSLALFGPLGVGLLLVRTPSAGTKGRFAALTVVLFGAELAYSVLIQSKAPLLSVVLFAVIGFVLRGWTLRRSMVVAGVAVFVAGFPALQGIRETAVVSTAIATADQRYPALWRPFLPLLRRFDLLSAATDAAYFPGAHWLGWDYLLRLLHGLLPFATPASWVPYGSAGLSWTAEVRNASLPKAGLDVSLAEGFAAEGYVWLGWLGIALLAVAVAAMGVVVSSMVVSRNPFACSTAILLLSQPLLFERGLLGIADTVGQSAQAALAFAGLWWLLDGRARHGSAADRPATAVLAGPPPA